MNLLPLTPDQEALLRAVDGAGDVSGEAGDWRAIGAAIRGAQGAYAVEIDVVDDVMLSIALHDAVAGDIDVADDVMLSIALHDAVAGDIDVADDVMLAIALHDAVAGDIDVADDVMLAIAAPAAPKQPIVVPLPVRGGMPRWASLGGVGAVLVMAAAALFALNAPVVTTPVEIHQVVEEPAIVLAAFNEAEVEEIDAPESATVSVMQFDEGGPTIIFVVDAEG